MGRNGAAIFSSLTRREARRWLGAIVALGFAVRAIEASRYPLWYDEAITLVIAHWTPFAFLTRPVDPSPALYYWLTKWIVGDQGSVLLVRLPAIMFGVGAIPAIYVLARQGLGRRSSLVAAALIGLNLHLIDYSQEARPYSLLILLVLLSAIGFVRSLNAMHVGEDIRPMLALFGVAGLLAFMTHVTAVFWLGPASLSLLWVCWRMSDSRYRALIAIAVIATAILCTPEVVRMASVHRIALDTFNWLFNLTAFAFLIGWGQLILPVGLWGSPWGEGGVATLAAMLLHFNAGLWAIVRRSAAIKRRFAAQPGLPAVTAILLFVPVLVWLFGFAVSPIFMRRTILLGIVGMALAVALFDDLYPRFLAGPVAVALFAANLAIAGPVRPKPEWNRVADILHHELRPGDAIVLCAGYQAAALMHAMGGAKADIYTPYPGGMVKMTAANFGDDWVKTYFDTVFRDDVISFMSKSGLARRSAETMITGRIWLIETSCRQKRQVDAWIGAGRRQAALRLPPGPDFTSIDVDLIPPDRRVRPVSLPNPASS